MTRSYKDRWVTEGYQEALRDIREKLEEGSADAVREWLDNNQRTAEAQR